MRIHKNDNFNDWNFGHSSADILTDNSLAVAQNIKTRLQEWKYNFFANMTAGIDYRTRLGQKGQKEALDNDIKEIISNTEGVLSLETYEGYLNDRTYTVHFSYYDMYSPEILTSEVTING